MLLLAGSYFFYGYVHPWFLILIATSTVIDYCAARGMEAWPRASPALPVAEHRLELRHARVLQVLQLLRRERARACWRRPGSRVDEPTLRILLPVGISFYTFQAMSYTIDVYRGELRARRSLLDLAVFVSFFPHLVAGPIQRASFLLPQVEARAALLGREGARAASS